jgi:SulP family sulfate permease
VSATVVVLGVLLLLTPALSHVPRAVLAAVVVAAVASLIKPRLLLRLWAINRVEAVTAFVTFGVTLLTAPRIYWGVLTGVLMGLAHFLYLRLHPRIIEVGLHPDGSLRDRHLWKLPPLAQHLYALRMDDELDFASATALERAITEHLAAHPDVQHVCLFAQPINRIDATGVECSRSCANGWLGTQHHAAHQRYQAAGGKSAAPRGRAGRRAAAADVPHGCGCVAGVWAVERLNRHPQGYK